MEWAFSAVLKENVRGRKVVIWGTGKTSLDLSAIIASVTEIEFYISRDALLQPFFMGKDVYPAPYQIGKDPINRIIDKSLHYVVILASEIFNEIRECLREMGFLDGIDFYDWYPKYNVHQFDVDLDGVKVGKGSYFSFSKLELSTYIESIGRFCSINNGVQIERNHQMKTITTGYLQPFFDEAEVDIYRESFQSYQNRAGSVKTKIGNDVWIGANVFINASKCASIGDGAIIGTFSLVLDDVPPYAVVYGIPARIHRYRYTPEEIEILINVRWWEWDNKTIRANSDLLMNPDKFFRCFSK